MHVLGLTATQFIKPMSTGRNRPLLLGCQSASGERFEVVVKLRGAEMNEKAQIAELISAQLADDLGLAVPLGAIVELPIGFDAAVPDPAAAASVRASPGPNFGSVHLGSGFTTWPAGRASHGGQRDLAAAIFAFDTLVQNPDRRAENPNLWARSDRLGVYDHEQAFSFLFLPIIGGSRRPWIPSDQAVGFHFLEQHIFYSSLRGSSFDLDPFEEKLGDLSDRQIDAYATTVPNQWRQGHDLCKKVVDYLREARQERSKLVKFIKHILR
jgi:hypothetical protein